MFVWLKAIGFIYLHRKKKQKEGNRVVPFSFFTDIMSSLNQVETVEKLLLPLLEDDIFLIEIKVKPTNNIKIFLDADGGLGIEKCIKINRRLYKIMEEMAIYPDGDFSLEVSSPGIGEPLKKYRQYVKNKGREVEVQTIEGATITGLLQEVNEEEISIETTEGKGKKLQVITTAIPFNNIKQTKVLIKF